MLSLPHATAVVHVATPAQLRRDAPPAASRRADSRAVVGALPLQRPSHLRALRDSALCWSCSRAPLLRGSRPRRGAAVTVSALPLPAALAFGLPEVTTALLLALQVALLYVVVSGFAKQDARFNKQVARFNKQFSTLGISIGILSQLVARPRIAALFGEAVSRPLVLRSADDVVRALTPDGALRSAAEREAAVARLLRPLAEQHRAWRARFRVLLAGLQKAGVPGGATLCDTDALPEAQFTAALATARRAAGEFFRRTPRKGGPPREQPLWWRAELDALQMYATAVQAGADSGATSSLLRAEFIAYLSCLLLGIRYPELEADCAGSTAVWAAGDDGASLGEIKTK